MKAVILAAGYATRLYPLTKDFPKPLLEVGGRTLLDHLVSQLASMAAIDGIVLVSNHRFHARFADWGRNHAGTKPITVLDDGTTSNEQRLGAIGDLQFALQQAPLHDDLLVAAADNLLQFALADFVSAFQARPASHVCVHALKDAARLRRTGVVVVDEDDRVLEFAEKPAQPKSNLAVPPLYLFPRATLPRVAEYLAGGGSSEAPGHFLEWLCRQEPVYAHRLRGTILDIGTPESLAAARAGKRMERWSGGVKEC